MALEIAIGALFSFAGLACLFFSFCLLRSAFRKRKTWKTTTGIVVGYNEYVREAYKPGNSFRPYILVNDSKSSRAGHGDYNYRSQVQFTTQSGKQVVITSNKGSNRLLNRIGDRVTVLYDLNDPDKGVLSSFSNLYMPVFLFAFIAVTFLGLGGHILCTLDFSKM
ncbi:MAG TPA: DUF3592 domain-containing protein [Verrucomicrobiae bacterium]|nr:DUF3592 domain-containing protein [Verrucomicrobiae bacterium]